MTVQSKQEGLTLIGDGYKKCADCGLFKPLDEFYLNKREKDGRSRICKGDAKLREFNRRRAKGIPLKNESLVGDCLRICANCGQIKPLNMFYARSDRKGHKSDCIECILKKRAAYRLSRGIRPYYENKDCPAYLGIHVAEQVLSHYFKNVNRMPMGNQGFDFVCDRGFKIDVKASTGHNHHCKGRERWQFEIKRNTIADYFLCLAFDNREDLNPEHVWLIPGDAINDLKYATISETTLAKWSHWEKPLAKVISCCNILKEKNVGMEA